MDRLNCLREEPGSLPRYWAAGPVYIPVSLSVGMSGPGAGSPVPRVHLDWLVSPLRPLRSKPSNVPESPDGNFSIKQWRN